MIALVLRHRFLVGPVLLSSLTKRFDGLEHRAASAKLAREYLPEQADRLVAMPVGDAPALFVKLFSARYFPVTLPETGREYDHASYRLVPQGRMAQLVRAMTPVNSNDLNTDRPGMLISFSL